MNSKRFIFQQTGIVLLGQILCDCVMFGIFALMDRLDGTVLLGALIGSAVATANFFLMAVFVDAAADKATAQDVKGAQGMITLSYLGRMLGMALIFYAAAKSGRCNLFALLLPLVFVRPSTTVGEFFRKSGE
ncbi:MAG: ATP synthase subunit I [Firmicutes bacterium]|nr:ATP synthase subunit I [Bacillota bacterium]